jgi:hypothetical protein
MIGLNDTIPTYVETSERSAVPIQNIVPGDHVYESRLSVLRSCQ